MATSVKITALNGIGSNIGPNTLFPVVNMAGGPNTESATMQNIGNVILNGAGGPFFAPAQVAIYSQSVVNAAQPNITSVGTLSVDTLKISGGQNGYILQTDGNSNLNWVASPSAGTGSPGGSNTQVQFNNSGLFNGTPSFTFNQSTNTLSITNIVAGNISALGTITGNVSITEVTATGNITANYYIGNGSQLTGITASAVGSGPTTAVQYNDNGAFSGSQDFTYDAANSLLTVPNIVSENIQANVTFEIANGNVVTANFVKGDGSNLTNISNANYASFSDKANIADLANSVAVANVVGIGNIAVLSLDGNGSNILYGNGVFGQVSIPSNILSWTTAPESNVALGEAGQVAYDEGGNLFVCVATNTWSKISGTTSW